MSTNAAQLSDQLDWHWTHQLRPRFDGLTDAEYFWAPVPNCWTVHPDARIDFTYPPPDPAPGFKILNWVLSQKPRFPVVVISAALDGAMTKAPLGGENTGPNPTDRAKKGRSARSLPMLPASP